VGGYTRLVERMLDGIPVELSSDFLDDPAYWKGRARRVIFSGPVDALFDYHLGRLEYRSLRFEDQILPGDWQGCATVNYTDREKPFTRILEHKHYWRRSIGHTWITREHPCAYDGTNDPYYPVRDAANEALHRQYVARLQDLPWLRVGGRLGSYQYLNMDQAIAQAMKTVRDLLKEAA
jgi:UDP-galactopyranose mutase